GNTASPEAREWPSTAIKRLGLSAGGELAVGHSDEQRTLCAFAGRHGLEHVADDDHSANLLRVTVTTSDTGQGPHRSQAQPPASDALATVIRASQRTPNLELMRYRQIHSQEIVDCFKSHASSTHLPLPSATTSPGILVDPPSDHRAHPTRQASAHLDVSRSKRPIATPIIRSAALAAPTARTRSRTVCLSCILNLDGTTRHALLCLVERHCGVGEVRFQHGI
ncbi:hypothetical protein FB451DRAFT_1196072, partial [Mycena latifolia]